MGRTSRESLRFTIKKRLAASDKKSEQTLASLTEEVEKTANRDFLAFLRTFNFCNYFICFLNT